MYKRQDFFLAAKASNLVQLSLIHISAADSFAAIRERRKLGTAIAAIIRMIATTINNSMREKPFVFRIASPKVAG